MENNFIGYHCSNFEIKKDDFQQSVEDYKEYLKDIIRNLPPIQKKQIQQQVDNYNQSASIYEHQPISLVNLPRNFQEVELYDEDAMEELCNIVDTVIGGIIFVDANAPATEFGTNCYKVYMSGKNYFAIPDKGAASGHEKLYVYFGGSQPMLEKAVEYSLVSEEYKNKLQILAGIPAKKKAKK